MYLNENQINQYTCKLGKKFFEDFKKEYPTRWWHSKENNDILYSTNDMLEFALTYSEINDKSKQYYYYMCKKTFADIDPKLEKKYNIKFAVFDCGNEIYNSFACKHSNLLINCNGIEHSFGCYKCKFSDHLLYCTDIRHDSYMAFNKKVTKERFDQLIKLSPQELEKVEEFDLRIYTRINSLIEYIYKLK